MGQLSAISPSLPHNGSHTPLSTQLPLLSLVTVFQFPLEDTRLWLDPMETLLDPSTRFPDSSLPSPSRNRRAPEMSAFQQELVLLPLPTLSMPSMPRLPTMEKDQLSPNWSMPESQPTTMLSPMPSQLLLSSLLPSTPRSLPPANLSQSLLEATRPRPETTETSRELFMRFPDLSQPQLLTSRRTPMEEL